MRGRAFRQVASADDSGYIYLFRESFLRRSKLVEFILTTQSMELRPGYHLLP
jgi:hypothetical protein